MAGLIQAIFGGGGGEAQSAQVAQQSMMVKNGNIIIQLSPENKQIYFAIEGETEKHPPIAFDLQTGTIINASFPAAKEPDPVPL
jgi:hypothetical protein